MNILCDFDCSYCFSKFFTFPCILWYTPFVLKYKLKYWSCSTQNLELYAFTANIKEVMKFYNLGDKTFETD